jgi:hypothetical protein
VVEREYPRYTSGKTNKGVKEKAEELLKALESAGGVNARSWFNLGYKGADKAGCTDLVAPDLPLDIVRDFDLKRGGGNVPSMEAGKKKQKSGASSSSGEAAGAGAGAGVGAGVGSSQRALTRQRSLWSRSPQSCTLRSCSCSLTRRLWSPRTRR